MTEALTETPTETVASDAPSDIDGILEERRAARAQEAETTERVETEDAAEAVEADEGATDTLESEEIEQSDDPTSEDAGEPEEVNPDGEEGSEEPEAVNPPHFWDAEGKEHFATLDPVTQRFVVEQDRKAQGYVTRTQQALVEEGRAKIEAATQQVEAKRTQLDQTVQQLRQHLTGDVLTDVELSNAVQNRQITTDEAMAYRLKREANAQVLKEAEAAQAQAHAEAEAQFVQERNRQLAAMNSPILNPEVTQPFLNWLSANGASEEDVRATDASVLHNIAYKAFLYDQGQAKLKATPKPKPKAPAKPVRPGTKGSGNSQSAKLKALQAKADQSGSLEDILAYRKAKRQLRAS